MGAKKLQEKFHDMLEEEERSDHKLMWENEGEESLLFKSLFVDWDLNQKIKDTCEKNDERLSLGRVMSEEEAQEYHQMIAEYGRIQDYSEKRKARFQKQRELEKQQEVYVGELALANASDKKKFKLQVHSYPVKSWNDPQIMQNAMAEYKHCLSIKRWTSYFTAKDGIKPG